MCPAIPMLITEIDGFIARCEAHELINDLSLSMRQGEKLAAHSPGCSSSSLGSPLLASGAAVHCPEVAPIFIVNHRFTCTS